MLGCGVMPTGQVNLYSHPQSCIVVGNTATEICASAEAATEYCMPLTKTEIRPIPAIHTSVIGNIMTTSIIMANWPTAMWQNVVNRAIRMLASGPLDRTSFWQQPLSMELKMGCHVFRQTLLPCRSYYEISTAIEKETYTDVRYSDLCGESSRPAFDDISREDEALKQQPKQQVKRSKIFMADEQEETTNARITYKLKEKSFFLEEDRVVRKN
ncbi:hypothetical protein KIN20_029537 [Parelaphostrongylus tenuis]|uniref:Uncharacterized protein n=1 Tax=Parelaphostrongylus tenuis TaxID=148309 RepID=A0AAD5R2L7_PARTN|nr:hypothetical protein KIN20_029537 [Parelaphostrongylus tenuis]